MYKSILILDDDTRIVDFLLFFLNQEFSHADTYFAYNGQQGLEIWKQLLQPCLVIADIKMPIMNGREFYRHYTALGGCSQLVLFLTGDGQPVEGVSTRSKPFESEGLRSLARIKERRYKPLLNRRH